MAALTGCQTSRPPPERISSAKTPLTSKPKPNRVPTHQVTANIPKLPSPEAATTNPPLKLVTIPSPLPPGPSPIVAIDSDATKSKKQPLIRESQTSLAATPLAVANPTLPDSPVRTSLPLPDSAIIPVSSTSARLTLDTSAGAAPPPGKIASSVNLPALNSSAGALPESHLPAVIHLLALDDQPLAHTTPSALEVFSRSTLPEIPVSAPVNLQALRLHSALNPNPLPPFRSNQFITLPLPASVSWPANVRTAVPAPGLSNWLASPAPAPQPAPAAPREARDNLHQKVYNFILGNP